MADREDEFGGNQTWVASGAFRKGRGVADLTPAAPTVNDSDTTSRLVGSGGWSNTITVPIGGSNIQVLTATAKPRLVMLQNIGNIAVWITNGNAIAPNGWRLGALETIQFTSDQPVYLCGENLPTSYPLVINRVRGEARLVISG